MVSKSVIVPLKNAIGILAGAKSRNNFSSKITRPIKPNKRKQRYCQVHCQSRGFHILCWELPIKICVLGLSELKYIAAESLI